MGDFIFFFHISVFAVMSMGSLHLRNIKFDILKTSKNIFNEMSY